MDFANQTREVTRAYLGTGGNSRSKEILRLKKNLEEKGGDREMVSQLMDKVTRDYSSLKLDHDRAILDFNRNYTFVNILNKPFPADKKSYPVRWIIVVVSVIAVMFLAILVISILERRKIRPQNPMSSSFLV